MKGTCEYHRLPPYPAEKFQAHGQTYVQLRCPECNRKRGQRLVRRSGMVLVPETRRA